MTQREILSAPALAQFDMMLTDGDQELVFAIVRRSACDANLPRGWNKYWAGAQLNSWFGNRTLSQPIRLAALEIEADDQICSESRAYLTSLWRGEENPHRSLSAASAELLEELGIPSGEAKLSKAGLRLLQRLNLDARENPFVERWWWSSHIGVATLSDGGRVQIRSELAFWRAVESSLDCRGLLSSALAQAFHLADAEGTSLALSGDSYKDDDSALRSFTQKLEFYGLARPSVDGVILTIPPGDILASAAKVFSE